MKIRQLFESTEGEHDLMDVLDNFLPFIINEYKLTKLPKIKLVSKVPDSDQPTFGKYVDHEKAVYLAILDRHPLDILRTFAHELAHFKQDTEHRLNPYSGETGSEEENEAHELAGIAMRHFNKAHPEYFSNIIIPQSK
jgi:hypothetical protein